MLSGGKKAHRVGGHKAVRIIAGSYRPKNVVVVDTETPEGAALLLDMVIAYLAGHSGKRADELRHKLDNLADEERRALVAFLSKPTHEGGRG